MSYHVEKKSKYFNTVYYSQADGLPRICQASVWASLRKREQVLLAVPAQDTRAGPTCRRFTRKTLSYSKQSALWVPQSPSLALEGLALVCLSSFSTRLQSVKCPFSIHAGVLCVHGKRLECFVRETAMWNANIRIFSPGSTLLQSEKS